MSGFGTTVLARYGSAGRWALILGFLRKRGGGGGRLRREVEATKRRKEEEEEEEGK